MLNTKLLAAAIALTTIVTGCATAGPAEPHQHMRDAKQGSTLPQPAADQPARKPLHDHREMK